MNLADARLAQRLPVHSVPGRGAPIYTGANLLGSGRLARFEWLSGQCA